MIQKILAAVVGTVVAVVVVMVCQAVSAAVVPPPAGLDWRNAAAMADYMRGLPTWQFAVVILGYGAAAFIGGWVAALVAKGSGWPNWVPAGVLIAANFVNVSQYPHPMWFPAVAILTILAGGWLSGRLSRG
jgi:ABC-type microcin C transport system permease subunit YejB